MQNALAISKESRVKDAHVKIRVKDIIGFIVGALVTGLIIWLMN